MSKAYASRYNLYEIRRRERAEYNAAREECIRPIKALLDTTHTNLAGLLWPIENIGSTYEEYEMDSSRLTQRILEAFEAELEDLERELDSYEIGRP
jgi:hypothetical protein